MRHVIFDLDGTLADTWPLIFPAYRAAFAPYLDREFSDQELLGLFGASEEGIIKHAVPDAAEDAIELYIAHYRENHHLARLFDGIERLLSELVSFGFRMAVVTGKGPRSAHISIDGFGISHYFDAVRTGSEKGSIKRDSIAEIVELWSVFPREVAYVGDVPQDVIEAKSAGVKSLAAVWAPTVDQAAIELESPDATLASPADLLNWLISQG